MDTVPLKIMMLFISHLDTPSASLSVWVAALAGSIIFCASDKKHPRWTTVALFTSSTIIGITSSDFVASVLSYFISQYTDLHLTVPRPVGATVSAVISVRLLMHINGYHPKGKSLLARMMKGLTK